jgi:hypothetical protein
MLSRAGGEKTPRSPSAGWGLSRLSAYSVGGLGKPIDVMGPSLRWGDGFGVF